HFLNLSVLLILLWLPVLSFYSGYLLLTLGILHVQTLFLPHMVSSSIPGRVGSKRPRTRSQLGSPLTRGPSPRKGTGVHTGLQELSEGPEDEAEDRYYDDSSDLPLPAQHSERDVTESTDPIPHISLPNPAGGVPTTPYTPRRTPLSSAAFPREPRASTALPREHVVSPACPRDPPVRAPSPTPRPMSPRSAAARRADKQPFSAAPSVDVDGFLRDALQLGLLDPASSLHEAPSSLPSAAPLPGASSSIPDAQAPSIADRPPSRPPTFPGGLIPPPAAPPVDEPWSGCRVVPANIQHKGNTHAHTEARDHEAASHLPHHVTSRDLAPARLRINRPRRPRRIAIKIKMVSLCRADGHFPCQQEASTSMPINATVLYV
ncbi:hypothetical protein C0992_009873, partial [Termitomyces sp. T32_za158]